MGKEVLNRDSVNSQKVKILKDKCNFMYKAKKPFMLVKSGSSYELISTFYNDKAYRSGFSTSDLNFIKSVKNYVKKNDIDIEFNECDYSSERIDYIKVNKFKVGDVLEDLRCIDIKSAYWQTALNLGIISKEIYDKGMNVGKVVRLAALGSLAKKKDIWSFDGKELKKMDTVRSEYENLWFAICKKVSDIMNHVVKSIGDDFVFYWVDGIYVKRSEGLLEKITKIFEEKGYFVHLELIPKVTFHENGFDVQSVLTDNVKNFSYDIKSDGKKLSPVSDYLENKRLLEVANRYAFKK